MGDAVEAHQQLALVLERVRDVGRGRFRPEGLGVGLVGEHDQEDVLHRRQLRRFAFDRSRSPWSRPCPNACGFRLRMRLDSSEEGLGSSVELEGDASGVGVSSAGRRRGGERGARRGSGHQQRERPAAQRIESAGGVVGGRSARDRPEAEHRQRQHGGRERTRQSASRAPRHGRGRHRACAPEPKPSRIRSSAAGRGPLRAPQLRQ